MKKLNMKRIDYGDHSKAVGVEVSEEEWEGLKENVPDGKTLVRITVHGKRDDGSELDDADKAIAVLASSLEAFVDEPLAVIAVVTNWAKFHGIDLAKVYDDATAQKENPSKH